MFVRSFVGAYLSSSSWPWRWQLLFTEMSVPACEEAYLITNWLVNHRLSRLIRDVEAHLLERTAEDMAKLEAPLPLRRPAKASSLPRTGHWWKEVRFDREAVMIAATERYYQQVFHLPLSENLLLGTPRHHSLHRLSDSLPR